MQNCFLDHVEKLSYINETIDFGSFRPPKNV